MAKHSKRILSLILALSMFLSMLPSAFAEDNSADGISYFDFEASEYEVKENAGELRIKIVRHGNGNDAAGVAFKVADFLSDYGTDYVVLGEDGNELEKVYGEKPDISELEYDGNEGVISVDDKSEFAEDDENGEEVPHASPVEFETDVNEELEEFSEIEETDEEVTDVVEDEETVSEEIETEETVTETENIKETETVLEEAEPAQLESDVEEETSIEEAEEALSEDETAASFVNSDKKSKSRGSSLLDAQAKYLNLPDAVTKEEKEDVLDETLDDMYTYFLSAEGASGTVHFRRGEKEKYITIKLIDNDDAESNKVFMIALMGTDSEDTTIAANATTYVTIVDDEPLETACFDLIEDGLVLSKDTPTAYITIERSSGIQCFSTVYLSTVTQTAKTSAYESFDAKAVSFVPGETEKKIEVKAYDFSEFAYFGLRLEGDSTTDIGNHYAEVYIASDDGASLMSADDSASDDISLMSDDTYQIGSSYSYYYPDSISWKEVKNGSDDDNDGWINGSGNVCLKQYDKNCYTMYVTTDKLDLVGVESITYSSKTENASNKSGRKYTTFFETDSDQTFAGNLQGHSWNGNSGWKERTLYVDKSGDSAYLKFSVKATGGGDSNPYAELDWFQLNNAKYTFSLHNSAENFNRKIYDFISGTPKTSNTFYDGETNTTYNPGGIKMTTIVPVIAGWFKIKYVEKEVSKEFYVSDETITISAENIEKNELRGIHLKGVYFAKKDKTIYDGKSYATNNVYWVEADKDTHEVKFSPNTDFLTSLRSAGVISNVHSEATIEVYPVFEQDTVSVKFSKDSYGSYIKNAKNIEVPINSVIRVEQIPATSRTASGIYCNNSDVVYYEKGNTKYSGEDSQGEIITETDYTKADIVASEDITIKPNTGKQTFYVGYSPRDYKSLVEDGIVTSLENAVVDTSNVSDEKSLEKAQKTNESGYMWLSNPYIGRAYTLTAYAPEGYYVYWGDLTGDTNGNGTLGDDGTLDANGNIVENPVPDEPVSTTTNTEKSKNPTHLYGSRLNITLDLDNTRYYYTFMGQTNSGKIKKSGIVTREVNSLYSLSKGVTTPSKIEPVVGAWVDVAGSVTQTDANGKYTVELKGIPSWGVVSAGVTYGNRQYFSTAKIEAYSEIRLPALEMFDAKGVSAKYGKGTNTTNNIASNYITAVDDVLSVSVSVSSDNVLKPADARFFVYNDEGMSVVDCADNENYTTDISTVGNKLTATLSFNPKEDIGFGYKLYVQFADANGTWYSPIDVGYTFFSEISLDEFVFPLIGSSSLEDLVTSGFVADIIGNPLGDMSVGTISGFETESSQYTPEAAIGQSYESKYTWQKISYQYGWSKEFNNDDDKKDDEDSEKKTDTTEKIYEDITGDEKAGKAVSEPSKYQTKSSFKWSLTPSVGFNLTLSQRQDGKNYFEDLIFFAKVDMDVKSKNTIALPVGINIAIDLGLDGNIAAVYHMYVDYEHDLETEDAVEYTSETFGLFKNFNNSVRREGYIFLNPKVSVMLGIEVAIVQVNGSATFDFDMDFQFTEAETYAYGDMTIDLEWGIDLVGFTVYSNKLYGTTEKLFSKNTNEHIDFEYATTAALMMLSETGFDMSDGEFATDRKIDRAYLDSRSEWLGEYGGIALMSVDASMGTEEVVLQTGTSTNPYMSITKISDSEMLMIYVDDAPERADVNKRAVYYSIGDGEVWSEPQLIDDDDTLDDYPNVQDLGNGQLIVSWSSANKVHNDDAEVTDVLASLEIKTAFFDKSSKTFGDVTQLTKTTDEDYTADVMPRASYDEETGKIILYYTKTEYTALNDVSDLYNENTAPSLIAYLFYENDSWSNDGSVYTDDELYGFSDTEKEQYKEQWYGQRFLDLRIDGEEAELLRMVDSASICYNGLSIFAWTVDWDRDLTTTTDRDVFIQIYNFAEETFTHNIRVTSESGYYTSPKLARSDNATYLFFGAQDEDSEHGEIRYLNVTDVIKNDKYSLVENGATSYYVLSEYRDAVTYELEDGSTETIPARNVTIGALPAVECDNVTDYDVNVDENGKMYLFWTEVYNDARQVVASVYNETDDAEEAIDTYWSEAFVLSNGEENTYYTGLGTSVMNGTIYVGSAKGYYADSENTALVMLTHEPFENAMVTDIEIENEYPVPGATVDVIVTITNNGLLQSSEPITVNVDVNGNVTTQEYEAILPGGASEKLYVSVELPTDVEEAVITAYSSGDDEQNLTVEYVSNLDITDAAVNENSADYSESDHLLTATVVNNGNAKSGAVTLNAYVGEELVGSQTLDSVGIGMSSDVNMSISIEDDLYTITEGIGETTIKLVAEEDNEVIFEEYLTATKKFSAEAIELLSSLTDVKFQKSYTIKVGEIKNIQPEFIGVNEDTMMVDWRESSDGRIAYIDYSNGIIAQEAGTITLTGIVVPKNETFIFDASGNATKVDWESIIPSGMIKTVTATIKVEDDSSNTRTSSGTTKYTITLNTNGGNELDTLNIKKNSTIGEIETPVKEGYVFAGWYLDEALTNEADLNAKVTSDITLYAKWVEETKQDNDSDDWINPFVDVKSEDWFYANVKYAHKNGLFSGTTENTFSPNLDLTRAMLVTVLYRAEGEPEVNDVSNFTDVANDAYYADAVAWAEANGIVKGISEEEFAPDMKITREQIAAIMYRYANYKGIEIITLEENLAFTDADEISEYAVSAMNWIVGQEIIRGYEDGTVRPLNNATRAEAAAVIQRFLEKIEAMTKVEE